MDSLALDLLTNQPGRRRKQAEPGFTLVEIAIAVAILGVALTTLLSLQSRYIRNYLQEESLTRAALYAHYMLTSIELSGNPPTDGLQDGKLLDGLEEAGYFGADSAQDSERTNIRDWRYSKAVSNVDVPPFESVLLRIQIAVIWGEAADERFELVHFVRPPPSTNQQSSEES